MPAHIQGLLNSVQTTGTVLAVHLGSVPTGRLGLFDHTVSFAGTAGSGCTGLAGHAVLHGHSGVAHLVKRDLAHVFAVLTLEVHYLHSQQHDCRHVTAPCTQLCKGSCAHATCSFAEVVLLTSLAAVATGSKLGQAGSRLARLMMPSSCCCAAPPPTLVLMLPCQSQPCWPALLHSE